MRCFGDEDPLYAKYHDEEWGVPISDDDKLFELLILEGAQAGLSWLTVLKRREGYRQLFAQFDPKKVALFSDEMLEVIVKDPSVIRNRKKIWSVKQNAIVFLTIQEEFGSFNNYLKTFAPKPIINRWKKKEEVPSSSTLSDAISKDLRKRGMSFVGTTIVYAFCQACGIVWDHLECCNKVHSC